VRQTRPKCAFPFAPQHSFTPLADEKINQFKTVAQCRFCCKSRSAPSFTFGVLPRIEPWSRLASFEVLPIRAEIRRGGNL